MEDWTKWFYYDESSPTCLRWAVERRSGKYYHIVKTKIDDVAGTLRRGGRAAQVDVCGNNVFVHRIVWEIHNGTISDGLVIDHIDGNPLNNKLDNLRLVTQAINSRNQRKPKNNTSGEVGVSYMTPKGRAYWRATWYGLDGKLRHKCFSVGKLGYDEALAQAIAYRRLMIEELNSLGAGYTERHGE
jgi:hypothetical protein